jgi:hypothetical protein
MYREGREVKIPQDLKERCDQELKKARIPKAAKSDIEFYLTSGDEPFTHGSLECSLHPGIVGLPWNFVYKNVREIERDDLRVIDGQSVNWDSKAGKKLLESVIQSEKAQRFVIMRELYMLDNFKFLFIPMSICVNTIAARAWINLLNKHPNFPRQSLFMRLNGESFDETKNQEELSRFF